jgi:hypothetical protein
MFHQSHNPNPFRNTTIIHNFLPLRLGNPDSTPTLGGTMTLGAGIPFFGVACPIPPIAVRCVLFSLPSAGSDVAG